MTDLLNLIESGQTNLIIQVRGEDLLKFTEDVMERAAENERKRIENEREREMNSAGFMDSKWCREEISEANAHKVGVLQVNWPCVNSSAKDQLSIARSLRNADFRRRRYKRNSSTLKTSVLEEIAWEVESIRARNIAARQDALTAEFVKEAIRQNRIIIKEPTYLVEKRGDDKFWYYIPAIGVPQSVNFHDSIKMLSKLNIIQPERVYIIYDDLSILPQWIEHLDWMSNYFEVKTIKKQDFTSWLQNTK